MEKFTIMGSSGFIGSHLVNYLEKNNFECQTFDIRKQKIPNTDLGNVIYCLGESDFLNKPFDTIESHVCHLNSILKDGIFESFLYLSSGRFYYNATSTDEKTPILINPTEPNDLYNISKIMGESLCYVLKNPHVRIVRMSNVTGPNSPSNLFIPSIIKDALENNKISLHSSLESEKDYIYITDVVDLLTRISLHGQSNHYNLASGYNTKSKDIVNIISKLTNCEIYVDENAKPFSSATISINKIKNEFNFQPISILEKIPELVNEMKKQL